ncbi:MAG: biliverdin-producing heme oxygenase [Phycisphaerales bacterium]
MTTAVKAGVMTRLKQETAEHHARAEGRALQQRMLRGTLSRGEYAAWLGQMLLVHRALEAAVERARAGHEALRAVTPERVHSARIEQDLRTLGVNPAEVRPIRATAALVDRIAWLGKESAAAVLGLQYVLEGSMNGNAYLASSVRRGLGLKPGEGDRYLDPHGEAQRGKWMAFREAVDACTWTVAEADAAVEGAKAMFEGIAEVCEELMPSA